jgi:hypothetical protein
LFDTGGDGDDVDTFIDAAMVVSSLYITNDAF